MNPLGGVLYLINGFLDGAFRVVFNITWSFLEALGFGLRELFMIFFFLIFRITLFSSIVSVGILIFFHRLSLEISLFLMYRQGVYFCLNRPFKHQMGNHMYRYESVCFFVQVSFPSYFTRVFVSRSDLVNSRYM